MSMHFSRTVSDCFPVLRQLRSIRHLWRGQFCSCSSCHLSCLGLTMAMQCSPDCRIINSVSFSPCWTPLPRWFSQRESMRLSIHCSVSHIGCKCCSGLSSSWQCSHTIGCIQQLCCISPVSSTEWRTWRQRLRSVSTLTLVVQPMRHSTIVDRAFSVIALRISNSLPSSITSSTPLTVFRRHLRSQLFLQCFGPDCVCSALVVLCIMFDSEHVIFIVKPRSPRIYDPLIIFVQ